MEEGVLVFGEGLLGRRGMSCSIGWHKVPFERRRKEAVRERSLLVQHLGTTTTISLAALAAAVLEMSCPNSWNMA